jgi:hypothetical protein
MLLMLMLVAALQTDAAMPSEAPKTWGPPVNGLRMAVYPVASGDLPSTGAEFYVAFQNVGDSDFLLNLGYIMMMGKVMEPFYLELMITDPTGKTRHFQQITGSHGNRPLKGPGRLEEFVVGLPLGSTYILRVDLRAYWDVANTKEIGIRLAPGKHRISARLNGRDVKFSKSLALLNFWKGSAESNVLEFTVSSAGTSKGQPGHPKS